MKHPRLYREALARFRRGRGNREDSQEIALHLLGGCEKCRRALEQVLEVTCEDERENQSRRDERGQSQTDLDYSAVFSRVDGVVQKHQLLLAQEAGAVPGLLTELEGHPRARQEVLASNSARFHVWPLIAALLERARRGCQRNPKEAEHQARLAIVISCLLDRVRYGTERVEDLTARSWGELGNVLRVQERYRDAEQAFRKAEDTLLRGTGDPVEKAGLLSLEASMWHDVRQFERAVRLLDRATALARRAGERHLQGVALIQKAQCDTDRGKPEAALPLLLQAQGLLDPAIDGRLPFVVQGNIMSALAQAGRFKEAAAGLEDARALCRQLDHPIDSIRLQYVEGTILHGLGRQENAESCFRSALQGMLDEGLDYDAALVGLDLAALLAQQNRHSEVRELAAAMLPVFTSHRIHREAIAALLVFQEAVKREKLSAQLVEELSTYLRNAASDPQLRFQPPAWLKSSKS